MEQRIAGNFVSVGRISDIPPNGMGEFDLAGEAIVVANLGDRVVAFQSMCSHMDGPLAQGWLQDRTVVCPWHGSAFSADTGEVLNRPATRPIRTYEVRIENGAILVSKD